MSEPAVVAVPAAPLFANADAKELADEVFHGILVDVLEKRKDGLCRVRAAYGYEGWTPTDALCFDERALRAYADPAIVTTCFADAQSAPEARAPAIAALFMGSRVARGESRGGYVRVTLADGQPAYLREECVASLPPAPARARVLQTARQLTDAPYRWGGKTRAGIDCSGLAWLAYYMNGVTIYRDAKIMDGFPVRQIPVDRAEPADLIFFPGHVALYVGDGRVLHASAANNAVKTEALAALPRPAAAGTVFYGGVNLH